MTNPGKASRGRRTVAAGLAAGLALGLAASGCVATAGPPADGDGGETAPSVSSAPTSVAPQTSISADLPVPSLASPSLPTVATSEPGRSSSSRPRPNGLRARMVIISGSSGSVSWRVRVPEFSGAPVAAEVNKRVRAAVAGPIQRAQREGRRDHGIKRRLDGEGTVVTNDGRTVQVRVIYGDYLSGTAHPADYVTTTVVDVARRRPITLDQVFAHPTAAYGELRGQILAAAGEQSSTIDRSGLSATAANWANWQSDRTGMVFTFADGQLGSRGLRQYAVPWSAVGPLLTGYATRVLAPR